MPNKHRITITHQLQFVDTIAALVNAYLSHWGRASTEKTIARQMLADRILKDDKHVQKQDS